MAHFINDRAALVAEAVDGLVAGSGGRLARLDGDPAIRVVLRADWTADRVAIVSGGGSGHEPAHAGFVGRGLLTAAVCGDVFASPSVDAVLAGILAVTGPAGCLVIIKNYAGDRLNFGLAAERARALGLAVETVTVADDVAIPGAAQPRGIAGTLLVHKVAGHAAESGRPLSEVAAAARAASAGIRSLGIAVSGCTMPGGVAETRLAPGQAELGLGIHGEPGIERIALPPAAALAGLMTGRLAAALPEDGPLALLVNNLGGTTALEMQVLTRAVLATPLGGRVRLLLGPAAAMTALDMHGASLSLMPLDQATEAALTAATEVPAWPRAVPVVAPATRPLPDGLARQGEAAPSQDPAVAQAIAAIGTALIAAEGALNALDARVGDGDTGTTFAAAARAVLADLDRLPQAEPAALCRALSDRLARVAGGSSGVLMSIFFSATGAGLADGLGWPDALARGAARLQAHGGARPGDRTLLDALVPALAALPDGLDAAARAAEAGAAATARMTRAGTGRSSYLAAADLAGVEDPGAVAVARAFAALAAAARSG
ncbi:dihydroxyacetone kinase subunit DhaK [Methylobacterium sp. EM32]|uniref:dihydroxyacetone kinase subunit DhaK n=1 Tax=Methylobacterium sp. EM32 TaxID=3163481 RepID=UPI0033B672C7